MFSGTVRRPEKSCSFLVSFWSFLTGELRSEVEQSILTQKPIMIYFSMLRTSTSLRTKKLHSRKHFKKLVFRVFHLTERKVFFRWWIIYFSGPKMVPFDDFWSNSMKTKEKHWFLIVFLCFSLVLGDSSENHEMPPSSDRKKYIIHHRTKNSF